MRVPEKRNLGQRVWIGSCIFVGKLRRSGAMVADGNGSGGFDWKRLLFILVGFGVFLAIYYMPSWKEAVDPTGKAFPLSREGKASIGLFLMAGIWWVFEVVPIGVTSLAIGVI